MPTSCTLKVGEQTIQVYALVSSRAVSVKSVVVRGRNVWALGPTGKVYCSDVSRIRERGVYPRSYAGANESTLSECDIAALDMLGVLDGNTAKKLKDEAQFRRDFKHRMDWLVGDAESLLEAGVKLPKDWRKTLEAAATKSAKKKATKRSQAKRVL